jgi:hypothetical protein
LQHAGFALRYTNFIEIMAPAFATPLLAQLRGSFGTSVLGWGLDFYWPRFTELGQTAILDATPVRHTRPVSGALQLGGFANPAERNAAIGRWTARYIPDINWRLAINFGGLTNDGSLLTYADDAAATDEFVTALEAGIADIAVRPPHPASMLIDYIQIHRTFGDARNKVGLFQGIAAVLAERQEAVRGRTTAASGA